MPRRISAVLEKLATDPAKGLTTEEATARLARDGPNKPTEATPPPWKNNEPDSSEKCHWELARHLHRAPFDWRVAGMFLGASLIGMFAGRLVAQRLTVTQLRVAFAWFVLAVGAFVIAKNWSYFF
ncbi:MAG TPA: cation-transporting P-type ATPase [Chthoniobacterales bacterium]|nr:cation-transporting P-type ATPase [Chthoniobacterales bacterium]